MKENYKISIIVPCYNQAHFIEESLFSVYNQTYHNWECIIVNDGSTDETERKALEWTAKDERFKYIKKQNGGLSSARNEGIKNITGDFVQFLDCDDFLYSEKLEKSEKRVSQQEKTVIITDFQRFDESTKTKIDPHCKILEKHLSQEEILLNWDFEFSIPIHCGLFSVDLVQKFCFDEELRAKEDWLFWLQVFGENPKVEFIKEYLVAYRMSSSGMTNNERFMQDNRIKAIQKLEKNIENKELLHQFFKKNLFFYIDENNKLKDRISFMAYKRTTKYKIEKILKKIGLKRK